MKKWLITGASSGFGRLLAEQVATNGDLVEAILTAVAADEPPLRIAVGTDAVQGIRASLTSRLSELDRWGLVPK
jgi:NAD(P)-dependent dehydrogenase (short-subunit alcohol dehydrogenase family)